MTRSRRAVLQTVGIGLTALAGCTALEGRNEEPSFDADALVALGEKPVPEPPASLPVSLPEEMVSRHTEQAGRLIEAVPSEPDLPNAAVVEELQQERQALVDRLEDPPTDGESEAPGTLHRLREARQLRQEAASLEAAYRAAIDELQPSTVADRRESLRTDLLEFEAEWSYRGDDPISALLVHQALESLRREVESGIEPERAVPEDPSTDMFGAGEVVGTLERGRAALSDMERIRSRYLDGVSDPVPYRSRISIAAARLRQQTRQHGRTLETYVEQAGSSTLPFDRSIEDTPLERLYYRAAAGVQYTRRDAERARHRGDQATALLETGKTLARLRALDAVVTEIRTDAVDPPQSADELQSERQRAIGGLQDAWETAPAVLSANLVHWGWVLVEEARDHLRGTGYEDEYTPDAHDAHHAFANYATARRLAAAVPATVADVRRALSERG